MPREFRSSFTTDQLIQIAHETLKPDVIRAVDALMRAHTSGSTPNWDRDKLIALLMKEHGGVSPDQIGQHRVEQQRKRIEAQKKRADATSGQSVVKIVDLSAASKPAAAHPNMVIAALCSGCGAKIMVTYAYLKATQFPTCDSCAPKVEVANKQVQEIMRAFIKATPDFYPIDSNIMALAHEADRRKLTSVSVSTLTDIYQALKASGQLLGRLTAAQVRAMTSEQLEARVKVDPQLGGADLAKAKEGQNRGAEINFSTNASRLMPFKQVGDTREVR